MYFSKTIFPTGLCAFSPCLDACYLALPASTTKGSALLYDVMECNLHCEVMPRIFLSELLSMIRCNGFCYYNIREFFCY